VYYRSVIHLFLRLTSSQYPNENFQFQFKLNDTLMLADWFRSSL